MEKHQLLKLRKQLKAKKPAFIRQDAHKKPEIKKSWRRPKGLHSKMRLHLRGYRESPSPGYGSPKQVKYLHPTGLRSVLINSLKELATIDPSYQGIIIAKSVGLKKKIDLAKKLKEKGITVLNIKDIDKFLKQAEQALKKRKEKKGKKEEEKTKKKEEIEKKAKEKKEKKLATKLSEEEKREAEKKEKDKVLMKKGV